MLDFLMHFMHWTRRTSEESNTAHNLSVGERRDLNTRWLHDEEQRQIAEVKDRLDRIDEKLQSQLIRRKS